MRDSARQRGRRPRRAGPGPSRRRPWAWSTISSVRAPRPAAGSARPARSIARPPRVGPSHRRARAPAARRGHDDRILVPAVRVGDQHRLLLSRSPSDNDRPVRGAATARCPRGLISSHGRPGAARERQRLLEVAPGVFEPRGPQLRDPEVLQRDCPELVADAPGHAGRLRGQRRFHRGHRLAGRSRGRRASARVTSVTTASTTSKCGRRSPATPSASRSARRRTRRSPRAWPSSRRRRRTPAPAPRRRRPRPGEGVEQLAHRRPCGRRGPGRGGCRTAGATPAASRAPPARGGSPPRRSPSCSYHSAAARCSETTVAGEVRRKLELQQVGEQVVVAKPRAPDVERGHERVGVLELLQDAPPTPSAPVRSSASGPLTRSSDRGAQQQIPHLGRLALQHLGQQVAGHGPLAARRTR